MPLQRLRAVRILKSSINKQEMKNKFAKYVVVVGMLLSLKAISQPNVIDKVIAVVGNGIVTKSQLESQYLQYASKETKMEPQAMRCKLLEQLMFQRLLLAQAQKDSVTVTDAQVDQELDRRIRYFINQFG